MLQCAEVLSRYSQYAVNVQSTYSQHTVNIQSTYSQHLWNLMFSVVFWYIWAIRVGLVSKIFHIIKLVYNHPPPYAKCMKTQKKTSDLGLCWLYVDCMLTGCWLYVDCKLTVCWLYLNTILYIRSHFVSSWLFSTEMSNTDYGIGQHSRQLKLSFFFAAPLRPRFNIGMKAGDGINPNLNAKQQHWFGGAGVVGDKQET